MNIFILLLFFFSCLLTVKKCLHKSTIRSWKVRKLCLWGWKPPPRSPQGKARNAMGSIRLYRKRDRIDYGEGSMVVTPTISPHTSNQNFERAILLNVFEKSRKCVLGWHPPLKGGGERVVSYVLVASKFYIERATAYTSEGGHLIGNRKLKVLLCFLLVRWLESNPPAHQFPKHI